MNIFKQIIREGETVPPHMGIAYHKIVMAEVVCYLVPLHWMVRLIRIMWIKTRTPTWTLFEKQYIEEIRYERKKYLEEGLRRGFVDGYLTKSIELPIPLKYEKHVANATLRLRQQFQRGLRKEDVHLF
jgi:hypothetical protein